VLQGTCSQGIFITTRKDEGNILGESEEEKQNQQRKDVGRVE
jgi:hypothetical protein